MLQKTPLGFDASVWEFYAPLLAGATLVLAEPGAHGSPWTLVQAIIGQRITIVQLVPSLLRAVQDEEDWGRCTTLRRLFCGGEALGEDLVRSARAGLEVEVCNLYGPTEVCIDATSSVYAGPRGRGWVPIGRPVDNVRAYVLDGGGEPVPVGVPGELHLGGTQVARGYLGRPDLTAERFVPDPFGAAGGERLYRTGDRVRWLGTGELEFLGRVDAQVKIRGFRIEPGEVEGVLRGLAGVSDAAVVAREESGGQVRLVGYVVGEVEVGALRGALRERLPEYMVPSAVVVLDALPLTANGKLDRRALPAPERGSAARVEPSTPTEALLVEIWSEVLEVEQVGVQENFFELGGHSLLATQVIARIRETFGVDLPLRAVFENPTIAESAVHVDAAVRAAVEEWELVEDLKHLDELSDAEVMKLLEGT